MSDLDKMYFDAGKIELDGKQYDLKELTRISTDDIDGELKRLPSTRFHIGQVEIGLNNKISEAMTDREILRSRKYMKLREEKKDAKLTEEEIKNRLKDDADLIGMEESIEAMKTYQRSLNNLLSALHDKKDAVLSLAYRKTEELRSQELRVSERR